MSHNATKRTSPTNPLPVSDYMEAGFCLYVPAQAAGSNKVYLDLWNGSAGPLLLKALRGVKDGSVAVTGTLGVKLFTTRTTAIGTGGTAAVAESATLTATVIAALDPSIALPDGISARSAPSGGATAGAVLCERNIFTEETNVANYEPLSLLPAPLIIPAGTGIRVVQGAVASVGNIAFSAVFALGD